MVGTLCFLGAKASEGTKKPSAEQLKALAFEDGPFTGSSGVKASRAPLIAVLTKGFFISKVAAAYLKVDGLDATEVMIGLEERLKGEEDVIFLHGVAYAGFNVVDIQRLWRRVRRPIILVLRSKPNPKAVKRALMKHFRDWEERLQIISQAGAPKTFEISPGTPLFFEAIGIEAEEAQAFIRGFTIFGKIPEPLRIARILAEALRGL